ncbi:MAG: hypothetical protein OXU23_24680 [Candidatus Poribacteria bacterium]|nr:hypothetical protein [Candidatus Poribacteria bacterium]
MTATKDKASTKAGLNEKKLGVGWFSPELRECLLPLTSTQSEQQQDLAK